MSLPEGYLPRKGDELLIRSRVTYNCEKDDADVHVEMIGAEHRKYMVSLDKIHSLYCRKWNEVDKVICSGEFDGYASIIGISEEWVWILCETGESEGSRFTLVANELEPYVEPVSFNGSQSAVGDDEEIKF